MYRAATFQVMFLGSGDCSRQVLLEQLSVGQAGQRIEIGQTVDSFFGPLTVCDFADNGKCQVIQVRAPFATRNGIFLPDRLG